MDRTWLTPKNALDNAMSSLRAFGDKKHREDTSLRTHEANLHKLLRGHVVGGRVFGYTNVDILNGIE